MGRQGRSATGKSATETQADVDSSENGAALVRTRRSADPRNDARSSRASARSCSGLGRSCKHECGRAHTSRTSTRKQRVLRTRMMIARGRTTPRLRANAMPRTVPRARPRFVSSLRAFAFWAGSIVQVRARPGAYEQVMKEEAASAADADCDSSLANDAAHPSEHDAAEPSAARTRFVPSLRAVAFWAGSVVQARARPGAYEQVFREEAASAADADCDSLLVNDAARPSEHDAAERSAGTAPLRPEAPHVRVLCWVARAGTSAARRARSCRQSGDNDGCGRRCRLLVGERRRTRRGWRRDDITDLTLMTSRTEPTGWGRGAPARSV